MVTQVVYHNSNHGAVAVDPSSSLHDRWYDRLERGKISRSNGLSLTFDCQMATAERQRLRIPASRGRDSLVDQHHRIMPISDTDHANTRKNAS